MLPNFGNQWDTYLPGVLWAYRNTPHESTKEKPSFLLFGYDCRTPTEAMWLPPEQLHDIDVTDYRQQLMCSLSSARELAANCVQQAQKRYKTQYDKGLKPVTYQLGDWVLVKFPHEESGKHRKLSRPWHGPYRVTSINDPDATVVKVYFPQDGAIQVHLTRVKPCPMEFPAGFYWYGQRKHGPGRPPKWIDRLMSDSTETALSLPEPDPPVEIDPDTPDLDAPNPDPHHQVTRTERELSSRYALRPHVVPPQRYGQADLPGSSNI